MKTAGMVQGTPDWQLDRMIETEAADQWARLNTPTDGETLRQAAKSLGYAIDELDVVCDSVNEAAEALKDAPEGDRVRSILDDMEQVLKDLKGMKEKWGAA